jgi:hypothetical protein
MEHNERIVKRFLLKPKTLVGLTKKKFSFVKIFQRYQIFDFKWKWIDICFNEMIENDRHQ